MTTRARALSQLDRIVDQLTPEVLSAFVDALRLLDEARIPATAVDALAQGNMSRALGLLIELPEFRRVRFQMQRAVATAFTKAATRQMAVMSGPGLVRTPFTTGDPTAIRQLETAIDIIDEIIPLTRPSDMQGFASAIRANIAAGLNPRDAIDAAKPFITLTEYDHRLWMTYEMDLRAGNYNRALSRALRDVRKDEVLRTLRASNTPMNERQITTMRNAYVENLRAMRAETWARTATLNSSKLANYAGWAETAAASGLGTGMMVKKWRTILDGRERPHHHAANGLTVPFDKPFPVDGGVMVPGLNVWNCRCGFTVHVVSASEMRKYLQRYEDLAKAA